MENKNVMVKIAEKNTIKIEKEPIVIFPLKKWEEIKEKIEDLEDTIRLNIDHKETRKEKSISIRDMKEKYKLE